MYVAAGLFSGTAKFQDDPCTTNDLVVADVTKVKKSEKIDNYFRFLVKVRP